MKPTWLKFCTFIITDNNLILTKTLTFIIAKVIKIILVLTVYISLFIKINFFRLKLKGGFMLWNLHFDDYVWNLIGKLCKRNADVPAFLIVYKENLLSISHLHRFPMPVEHFFFEKNFFLSVERRIEEIF